MENPVEEISQVIHDLTQSPPTTQIATLEKYFLPSASFTHPLVRVPSFPSSLTLLTYIYRWYKIMSPRITNLRINSIAFDSAHAILYVNLNQTFSIWAIPFHHAHVNLTTMLYLERGVGRGVTDGRERWYIRHQEDLYQTDQWTRFVSPHVAPVLVWVVHVVAALVCVGCVWLFKWLDWLEEREIIGDGSTRDVGKKLGKVGEEVRSAVGKGMQSVRQRQNESMKDSGTGQSSGQKAHEPQAFESGFVEQPAGSGRYVTAPVSHKIDEMAV